MPVLEIYFHYLLMNSQHTAGYAKKKKPMDLILFITLSRKWRGKKLYFDHQKSLS